MVETIREFMNEEVEVDCYICGKGRIKMTREDVLSNRRHQRDFKRQQFKDMEEFKKISQDLKTGKYF